MEHLQEIQTTLKKGGCVRLVESGEEIAEGVVSNLFPGELEFTHTDPACHGFKIEFAYKREWGGWKILHEDPFSHSRCTSKSGSVYLFRPVEESANIPMNPSYELVQVESPEEWEALHNLRRSELFVQKEGIVYNDNHPDDHAPNHFPLVLKLGGRCIGTARLDLFDNGSGAIRLVAVDPTLQRQGHGRVLEQKFEELARSKGVSKLFVNANPTAIGYYEKLGFVHEDWEDPAGPRTGLAKGCAPMTKVI